MYPKKVSILCPNDEISSHPIVEPMIVSSRETYENVVENVDVPTVDVKFDIGF